jgi:hypothetical protein
MYLFILWCAGAHIGRRPGGTAPDCQPPKDSRHAPSCSVFPSEAPARHIKSPSRHNRPSWWTGDNGLMSPMMGEGKPAPTMDPNSRALCRARGPQSRLQVVCPPDLALQLPVTPPTQLPNPPWLPVSSSWICPVSSYRQARRPPLCTAVRRQTAAATGPETKSNLPRTPLFPSHAHIPEDCSTKAHPTTSFPSILVSLIPSRPLCDRLPTAL